jgi:ABC-type branched-subunit amino acid transport system ATPase component
MARPLLSIRDLCVSYGNITAVRGISIDVEEGQIVTLIGANGAGKSTTLRAISGLGEANHWINQTAGYGTHSPRPAQHCGSGNSPRARRTGNLRKSHSA